MAENKTLEWMKRAVLPSGGLSAWQMPDGGWHPEYVEVSGYCIPTLLKWGEDVIACRVADWLLLVQNGDGSFNGLDGVPRPFDTSAVIEGLEAAYRHSRLAMYQEAANRAKHWMLTQTHEGHLKNSPANYEHNVYQLRAASVIGYRDEVEFWKRHKLIHIRERCHYLAYALEGLLNFGETEFAMPYIEAAYNSGRTLQPYYVDYELRAITADNDYCASAQMALLFHRVGFNAKPHYKAILKHIKDDGGVPQSTGDNRSILWAARYLLELQYALEHK